MEANRLISLFIFLASANTFWITFAQAKPSKISSEEMSTIIQDYKDVDNHIIVSHESSFEELLEDYVSLQNDVAFIEKVQKNPDIVPIKEEKKTKMERNFERDYNNNYCRSDPLIQGRQASSC